MVIYEYITFQFEESVEFVLYCEENVCVDNMCVDVVYTPSALVVATAGTKATYAREIFSLMLFLVV